MLKRVFLFLCYMSVLGLSACTIEGNTLTQGLGSSAESDIIQAVCSGNLESVKEAVSRGGDVNATLETTTFSILPQKMSLHEYAQKEFGSYSFEQIADYLVENGADLNYLDISGLSPLMNAAGGNHVEWCETFLRHGAEIDMLSKDGKTALDYAAERGSVDTMKILLSNGAVPTPDALCLALEQDNYEAANLLAKELQTLGIESDLPLVLQAAVTGDSYTVRLCCERGNLTEENKTQVGYCAAAFCSPEALAACVECGFDLEQQAESIHTPIEIAAKCGNLETVQYMLKHYPDAVMGNAVYAMGAAAEQDDVDMVKLLLSAKVDDTYALSEAAEYGSTQVMQFLLREGPSVPRDQLRSALYTSASRGHIETMQLLLPAEDWKLKELNTAWEESRSVEQRELCLAYGAKPTEDAMAFRLSLATDDGDLEMVEYLLTKGADPTLLNEDGSSALDHAVLFGFYEIAELLIECGADVNYSNGERATLHIAAMYSTNLTRLLVENGADVDVKTINGDTPLMLAIEHGKTDTAILLLQAGADMSIQNADGETAKDLAEKMGDEEMKHYFS